MPEQIRDGQRDVVEPALNGTRTVLEAVEKAPDVERVRVLLDRVATANHSGKSCPPATSHSRRSTDL
jgi:hypothetical protein